MRLLIRQLGWFSAVGAAQLAVDTAVLLLLFELSGNSMLANVCARASGATLGYVLNSSVTFRHGDGRRRTTSVRYAVLWLGMTTISTALIRAATLLLAVSRHPLWGLGAAKLAIELGLALLSFVVMRLWVFRPPDKGSE